MSSNSFNYHQNIEFERLQAIYYNEADHRLSSLNGVLEKEMFQTINEIPDEIKNIVELFYVRDAEIARSEAQRLKESNPELKRMINDVVRLFENAPDSVYLFYDKLNAIYTQNDILDDSFADFSLSDLPKDVDEVVEKPDSGLIDISNMQEPMDADDADPSNEKAELSKEDGSLPQSLSLLDDNDLPFLSIGKSLPDSTPKPAKPEKNTLQLGGDFDLNIELDFDSDGPDLDVVSLIDDLDKKKGSSSHKSSNDKREKSNRTLNWGTSDFDIFNDEENARSQKAKSVLPLQTATDQPTHIEEEFGQPLLSNEQVSARLAELSNHQQSSPKVVQIAEEETNTTEECHHDDAISEIEKAGSNIIETPSALNFDHSDVTGSSMEIDQHEVLSEDVDFFAGAEDVRPAENNEDVDFFAGAEDVRPAENNEEIDFFAGAEDIKPAENNEEIDFFAGAEDIKPAENNEEVDFFAGAEDIKPAENNEEIDFFAGAEDIKPAENNEEIDFFEEAEDIKPAENNEDVDFFAGAEDIKPAENNEEIDFFAGAEDIKPAENNEEIDFFAGAEDIKPAENSDDVDFFEEAENIKPAENSEEVDFFAEAEDVKLAESIEEVDFFAGVEETHAVPNNDIADAFAEVENSHAFAETEVPPDNVDAVVNEIGFPKWDSQLLSDEDPNSNRESMEQPYASNSRTDLFDSDLEHSSGLGERLSGQAMPQTTAVPNLGFRSVPEIPTNNNPTPVPESLNRNTAEMQFDIDAFALNGVRRSTSSNARVNSYEGWSDSRKTSPSSPNIQQERQSFMQVLENEKTLSSRIKETEQGTKRRRPNTMWGFQKRNNNALDEKFVSPTALNLTPIAPMDKIQGDQVTAELLTPVPPSMTETQKPTNVSLTPISIEPDPQQHAPEDGIQALENLKPYSRIPRLTCSMHELLERSGINSRAGFLLSMIDGCTSISDIFDLSMFPEPETAYELAKLEAEGVIVFD